MHVADHGVDRLARQLIVLLGAQLGGDAVVEQRLAGDLGGDGGAEGHPGELEAPSHDVEVARGEDQRDDGDVCDSGGACGRLATLCTYTRRIAGGRGGRTRVLPREERGEVRVVVAHGLGLLGGPRLGACACQP